MAQLVFSLIACNSEPSALPKGAQDKVDVILVSIDTLRADHLSSYGYERPTSPFLDELAAEGSRFAYARSASPWTLPAHTTMLTGQLPSTHHVVDDKVQLGQETPFLPELLQKAGWKTGGFVATLYVSKLFGFDRGFDAFEDFDLHTERKNLSGEVTAELVVDRALNWWSEQKAGEPVFLFLHFYDVHYSYDPPEPYASMFDRPPNKSDRRYKNYFHFKKKPLTDAEFEHQIAQYDESIRYVDAQLKRIDEQAKAAGRQVRWVITSDHGEEFGERGSWGHAHTLYAEQLHVPLIISGAGIPKSEQKGEWVGSHDLAPTIATWAGVEKKLDAEGIDLNPIMSGTKAPKRAFLAETTRFKTNRLSLLEDGYRLEWDLKSNKRELFAPKTDLLEAKNLAKSEPDRVKALQQRAEELLGDGWYAKEAGTVRFSGAYALHQGRRSKQIEVAAGERFQILPYDANVFFKPLNDTSSSLGPFAQIGTSSLTDKSPIGVLGGQETTDVEIDEATSKMLEQLGYMQGDSEE